MFASPAGGANLVTDSVASATAIATGHKVNNGVVSMAIPGDGAKLLTMLEYFQNEGKATGLVTTTEITHAIPACFAAHVPSRRERPSIGKQYLTLTRPNVLMGSPDAGMREADIVRDGRYTLVTNRRQLQALDTESQTYVAGLFGGSRSGHMPYEYDYAQDADPAYDVLPHLNEMTEAV